MDLAADPDCFSDQLTDGCQPFWVNIVYYRVLLEVQATAMPNREKPAAALMDGVPLHFAERQSDVITKIITQIVKPSPYRQ